MSDSYLPLPSWLRTPEQMEQIHERFTPELLEQIANSAWDWPGHVPGDPAPLAVLAHAALCEVERLHGENARIRNLLSRWLAFGMIAGSPRAHEGSALSYLITRTRDVLTALAGQRP